MSTKKTNSKPKTQGKKQNKTKTSEYYSLKEIKKIKAVYNVIMGERSNGKTYSVLEESLTNFIAKGERMAYVRRWQEDVIGRRASNVWRGLNENGAVKKISKGKYDGVLYKSGAFYCYTEDEDGNRLYNDDDLIGFTFALSAGEHDKSTSYPNVKTILFDEFLTRGTYLPDEFMLFMNTVSTIVRRHQDVTIYMLANTVNKFAPYFKEMGLKHVSQMTQGTIDVYTYGDKKALTVAVEYCASMEQEKKNNFYFAFDNPKLEMITGGAWELDIYPHLPIKYRPKDIDFTYFIEFNEGIYQCEVVSVGDNFFTYIHEKTTPIKDLDNDLIYTFDYIPKPNYVRNMYKPYTDLQKKLLWFFVHDRVFYQDNNVGDAISNYLKECKRNK